MVDTSLGISSLLQGIQSQKSNLTSVGTASTQGAENTFSAIFDQMLDLVGETDSLAADAEEAEATEEVVEEPVEEAVEDWIKLIRREDGE